jgi:hypothetical protein
MFDMTEVFSYKLVNHAIPKTSKYMKKRSEREQYAKWVILRLIFKCILKPTSILCVRKEE